ncbi:MAG: alpha/beta fold hydrolase [Spirochaetes bacterium]|nr:alpha/beta fold hydrolase [Spirochaetota bacterium]
MAETGPDRPGRLFKAAGMLIRLLRKFLGTRIRVHGLDRIPANPALFVVNHFTRFETVIMPWILWKYARRPVRSLAWKGLFVGHLGRFMASMGTMSTGSPLRNKAIISDLMKGVWSWLIYPEGVMVKDKRIMHGRHFVIQAEEDGAPHPPHTGAAVMALKSVLYKDDFLENARRGRTERVAYYQKILDIRTAGDLAPLDTVLVPVNLTFYPIRPHPNALLHFTHRLLKQVSERMEEELTIEGNILLKGDVDVAIGEPVEVRSFLQSRGRFLKDLPILPTETRSDLITRLLARPLTDQLMGWVYHAVTLNLDHLFASALFLCRSKTLTLPQLQAAIFLAACWAREAGLRLHWTLEEPSLDALLSLEDFPPFADIFLLAVQEEVLGMSGSRWQIRRSALERTAAFHRERLVGTLRVIANEVKPLTALQARLRGFINREPEHLARQLHRTLLERDRALYERDYGLSYRQADSIGKEYGAPFFLEGHRRTGIVLVHGYKASPGEIRELAAFLHAEGFTVYGVRLKGHGTTPEDLAKATWREWYDAVGRGCAIVSGCCSRVVVGGFSTGGLLALLAAARKRERLRGIFTVNAALKLADFKTHLVPALHLWNRLLTRLHLQKGRLEYLDTPPEFPETNYRRHPIAAVAELERLMKVTAKALPSVRLPALVIQAKHDPVVNPKSGRLIFDRIRSPLKELHEPEADRHVLVRPPGHEAVFRPVLAFLKEMDR